MLDLKDFNFNFRVAALSNFLLVNNPSLAAVFKAINASTAALLALLNPLPSNVRTYNKVTAAYYSFYDSSSFKDFMLNC
jgi:hypothetical protein